MQQKRIRGRSGWRQSEVRQQPLLPIGLRENAVESVGGGIANGQSNAAVLLRSVT